MANSTRRFVMSFRGSIPSSVSVADFPVRVFHAGQPVSLFHLSRIRASASRLSLFGSVPALQAARSYGPGLYTALGSVQFQSSCVYFVYACFLSSVYFVCAVLCAVFVFISTRFHYPVYACAIRSVIRYYPVYFCVCSCAICPDGEVVMSSNHSEADASPPRRPRPRVPSSVDYRKLLRLVLPKVRLGSDSYTVKKFSICGTI